VTPAHPVNMTRHCQRDTQRHQLIMSTWHVTVNVTHSDTSSSCQH